MRSVCVFCGSSSNAAEVYFAGARETGVLLARRGITLVYGGSHVGLMGAVADSCLEAGGQVIGVIPRTLVDREVAHTGLSDLRVVSSMAERKALMSDLSDAFLSLPGGFGTLDEMFEMLTAYQLGEHAKPSGLLNVNNYYGPLLALCDGAVREGFLHPGHRSAILHSSNPSDLLDQLASFSPVPVGKWWLRSNEVRQ